MMVSDEVVEVGARAVWEAFPVLHDDFTFEFARKLARIVLEGRTAVMDEEELKQRVDGIIAISSDDEQAHIDEDELHLELIAVFCPAWVVDEVQRLSAAEFSRWCA